MPRDTIVVQVGQCGNQLGADFFDALARGMLHGDQALRPQQPLSSSLPAFFRETKGPPVARAVLLDTEPRVIEQAIPYFHFTSVLPSFHYGFESRVKHSIACRAQYAF